MICSSIFPTRKLSLSNMYYQEQNEFNSFLVDRCTSMNAYALPS